MDSGPSSGERVVDTERTPPPASGSRKEGRNPTINATTTTNHEEKAAGAEDCNRRCQYTTAKHG
jgi:hypothetical protein